MSLACVSRSAILSLDEYRRYGLHVSLFLYVHCIHVCMHAPSSVCVRMCLCACMYTHWEPVHEFQVAGNKSGRDLVGIACVHSPSEVSAFIQACQHISWQGRHVHHT